MNVVGANIGANEILIQVYAYLLINLFQITYLSVLQFLHVFHI